MSGQFSMRNGRRIARMSVVALAGFAAVVLAAASPLRRRLLVEYQLGRLVRGLQLGRISA